MTLILWAVKCDTLWLQKDAMKLYKRIIKINIKDSVNPKIITFIELLIVTYKHEIGKKSND